MKFIPLTNESKASDLEQDYKQARSIGVIRLGKKWLFFRSRFKVFYIPYSSIKRYFRRIKQVPARLCCGRVNLDIEYLVICDNKNELAEIQLPGKRAAEVLMQDLRPLVPEASVGFKRLKNNGTH